MERITSKSLASTIWRKTAQRKPIHVSNPRNAPSLCRERYACPSSRALSDAISPSSPLVERRFLSTDVTEGKARECTGGLRRRAPKNERIHLSTSTPSSSYSSFLSFQSLHPYYRSLSIHLTPVESVRRHQPSHERFSQRKSFSTSSSSFDIFQKLKDPPEDKDDSGNAASLKKRKPSDRVIRLVDEVLNLSLIEAADLCDLCQEKLAERSGGPSFNASAAVGRVPFPHPASMFQGMTMPGLMPPPIMGGGSFPHGSPPPPPPAGASPASAASSSSSDTSETGAK
ncbi:ribosomal protein l7, partial [Cystoisospora suis]